MASMIFWYATFLLYAVGIHLLISQVVCFEYKTPPPPPPPPPPPSPPPPLWSVTRTPAPLKPVVKLRPASTTSLNQCSLGKLTTKQKSQWPQCFMVCLNNPCCKAVSITNCEQSYVKNEAMDFVKEVGLFERT